MQEGASQLLPSYEHIFFVLQVISMFTNISLLECNFFIWLYICRKSLLNVNTSVMMNTRVAIDAKPAERSEYVSTNVYNFLILQNIKWWYWCKSSVYVTLVTYFLSLSPSICNSDFNIMFSTCCRWTCFQM